MDNTIVGLYDDFKDAQEAVRELLDIGVSQERISLIANDVNDELRDQNQRGLQGKDTQPSGDVGSIAGVGAMMGGLAGFLLGLAALAIPGIGPVLAAGPMAAALAGAGLGALTGGFLGALMDAGVSKVDADRYAEGVRRGGTLLTVYTTEANADRVAELMNRHNPVNIEERANQWQDWQRGESEDRPAEGTVLDGTPYEAEGAQQPKRALPEQDQYTQQKQENEKSRARIYVSSNRH